MIFYKLVFTHVFVIYYLFGKIPSQSVELNLWSGVHQILTAMLRKSDVTWWPHLQEKRLGKLVQRILTKPLIGHWVTRWTTGKAGSLQGKQRQPAAVLMWMYENGGFWKQLRHGAQMLVNAHAPFKDGTVLSHYFVFVWASKKWFKTATCRRRCFRKGGEKDLRFQTRTDTCGRGQSWTKHHVFTFYIFWGERCGIDERIS